MKEKFLFKWLHPIVKKIDWKFLYDYERLLLFLRFIDFDILWIPYIVWWFPAVFNEVHGFFLFINNILFIYKYVKEKIYSLVHKNIHVYCTNLIQFNVIMTQVGVVFSAYADHWFPNEFSWKMFFTQNWCNIT